MKYLGWRFAGFNFNFFSRHLDGGELVGESGYLDGSFDAVLDYFFSVTSWFSMAASWITPNIRASALASAFLTYEPILTKTYSSLQEKWPLCSRHGYFPGQD
jgi:hypothetical protein